MQPNAPTQPRFLDQVRLVCRRSHLSPRTEEAYVFWIRRFILFHAKRHPAEMGKTEVVAFLNHLAGPRRVSASTQSQALNALLFLYKRVLESDPGWFDGLARVQRKKSLPVVLSEAEVSRVLGATASRCCLAFAAIRCGRICCGWRSCTRATGSPAPAMPRCPTHYTASTRGRRARSTGNMHSHQPRYAIGRPQT